MQRKGTPIDVTFTLQFGDELSQVERNPRVFCYLSDPLDNVGVEVPLPEDDAGRQISVTVQAWLPERVQAVPVDTQLCFYLLAERPNQSKVMCDVNAAFGMVSLSEVCSPGGFNADVKLTQKTANNLEKGCLRVRAGREMAQVGARIPWAPIGNPAQSPIPDVLPIEQEMVNYIQNVMVAEMAFPNTFPQTANVRIPIYFGDVGMLRKAPLPAAAYFLYKTPRSNLAFWENNLKTVMARDSLTPHDLDHMPLTQQARVLADMMCLVIQSMDYISDITDGNRKPIKGLQGFISQHIDNGYDMAQVAAAERFGDALRDTSGDCEDLGLGIGMTFSSFRDFQRADMNGNKQLMRLQEIATQYMAAMTLDSVTAAAVGDKSGKMGAHIKCNLLPKLFVSQCVEKCNRDMDQAIKSGRIRHDPHTVAIIKECMQTAKRVPIGKGLKDWGRELPVLILEGTGMFQTLGVDHDTLEHERVAVYKGMPSLEFCKKPIVHPVGAASTFFCGSMLGFSSEFLHHGINVGGMWMGYSGSASHHPGQFQRGITFEDLVTKSDNISIMFHPAFSADCMAWMRKRTAMRVPPRDLVITTTESTVGGSGRNAHLDSIVAFAKSMKRPITVKQAPVCVYMNDRQLQNPQIVQAIMRDIQQNRTITSVSYVEERLTDWRSQYRVSIHANVV